jgi:ribonuclease-3
MYQELSERIGISFNDHLLYQTAFTHKSYLNEHRYVKRDHNERMEFLGDAVLELIVTEYLYKHYPHKAEGDLTNWRSALVRGENLAKLARGLNLGKYLFLSRGEENSGGRDKDYILANSFESLLGAIYLDHNYKIAKKFIYDHLLVHLENILAKGLHIDAKSKFQELSQELLTVTPTYQCMKEEGPDHNKKFTMGAYLDGKLIAKGKGSSKQSAEQSAAQAALKAMKWE